MNVYGLIENNELKEKLKAIFYDANEKEEDGRFISIERYEAKIVLNTFFFRVYSLFER